MLPTTQTSRDSSRSFAATTDRPAADATWAIQPSPSRLLATWHVAVHALAVVSVLVSGLGWPLKLGVAAALIGHAALRRPLPPPAMYRHADGAWSLPALGLERLTLRPGTAAGPFWARLALGSGRSGAAATVVLLADQLGPEDWRRLQAVLRRRAETGTV